MRLWQVFLIAALLWVPPAVFNPPTRQQELRVLISARNMLNSGNFHRPEFQNQPRFRKPPMAYWMSAAGMALTGTRHAAWAGRLFFLLSAAGGIWLLIRIAGPSGIHAALIALFSFGIWRYAPLAETDMIQLTGILLFFHAWQRQAGVAAGLGISFACLSKGPGGFLVPILSLVVLFRFFRPNKKFMLSTLLIPLLLIGSWILYLMVEVSGLDQMRKDLSATFVDSAHPNPWYYYFYTLPLLMLPAGLLVFRRPKQKEQTSPLEHRTALTWLLVTLALLILTESKQRHYALMLLPPSVWLLSMRVQSLRLPRPALLIGAAALIGLGTAVYERQQPESRHADFLNRARPLTTGAPTLHVVGINSAVFDFHLGRHVENTEHADTALRRARVGDAVLVIRSRDQWREPGDAGTAPRLSADDPEWIRRLYLKKSAPGSLTAGAEKEIEYP